MDSAGVDDMFSSLGEKLGWFQFEDIDSALKSLNTKSVKKKKPDKRNNKTKKQNTKASTSMKKKQSAISSIEKSDKESDCTSSSSTGNSTLSSTAATNASDLKEVLLPHNAERDCEKISAGITDNSVVKGPSYKENTPPSMENSNLSSVTPVKEDSFDVNNLSVGLGHRLSSNNTFSDFSVSDDSVANITSGICKKIQFNSDDSSFLDSKLEKSASSNGSFKGKSSSEEADSALSTSDDGNNQSRTSDQFNMSSKLETDTGEMKKEIECAYVLLSEDDDDEDLECFIQKMLTPHKTLVGDSTNKRSVISDFSKIERQKNSDYSCSDSSSDKENNEASFNKNSFVTSHKNNDARDRKRNVCSPSLKEIPKPNQNWALRDKNTIAYSSSRSESCNSSSDDDDFETFLEKMKTPFKETPQWSPDSMKSFIVSSSDDSNEEESVSLYHRIRPISPEIDKTSLFGTPSISYTQKSSTHERGSLNDKENRSKNKTGLPFLTPKVKPSTEIFKKPSNNFPLTEIKKAPEIKPSLLTLSEITPNRIGLSDLKKNLWTCPNLKSSESLQKIRTDKPAEGYASFLKSLSNGAPTNSIDPNARKYIKQFKQYQVELLSKLFKIYNETVFEGKFPADFSIRFNKRLLTTAGHCILKSKYSNNRNECKRSAEICLATKVCDTPERVRDTLIHEMCHAAVWMFNGCREGHGRVWKAWARNANRVHPYLPLIERCHSYDIAKKYTYKCVKCGYSFGRHSKSLDTAKKVCGYCKGQFEVLLSNTLNGTPKSTPTRTPGKFALFVKEHYGTVKKLEKCSHKEVMEKLGAKFKQAQI